MSEANHAWQERMRPPGDLLFPPCFEALSGPTVDLAEVGGGGLCLVRWKGAPGQEGGGTPGLCFQCSQWGH